MPQVIKFIQVNIYKGKYLENLVEFLKGQNPDVVFMQEVCVGAVSLYSDKNLPMFSYIRDKLHLDGVYNSDVKISDSPATRFGNAVLSKLPIVRSQVVILKEFRPITVLEFDDDNVWPKFPRHMLDVTVAIGGDLCHAISCHGAWTAPPTDTQETQRQADLIAGYLRSLGSEPFVMGTDLNMPPESGVIKTISQVAKNLMLGSKIKQTTHPTIHKIAPRGYLVDYIFTSKHFKLRSLEAPLVTVSDHLPVVAKLAFGEAEGT